MLQSTHRNMVSINEVFLILGVFIPCFFMVIWQLNRLNPGKNQPKKATNAAESSVSELFAVQTEQIKEIMNTKTKQIKSLQSQLRQDQQEIEPETTEKQVTFEQITELVKVNYPQYSKILPLFKGEIMKAVKGMSLNEILQYIGSFTGQTQTGGFPESGTPQIPQDWDPNRA